MNAGLESGTVGRCAVLRKRVTDSNESSPPTASSLIAANRSRNPQAIAVKKHEDVRTGAPIDSQYTAERMDFAIEEWLHRTIHEHWFQFLNATDRTQLRDIHAFVDSRCELPKSVSSNTGGRSQRHLLPKYS